MRVHCVHIYTSRRDVLYVPSRDVLYDPKGRIRGRVGRAAPSRRASRVGELWVGEYSAKRSGT